MALPTDLRVLNNLASTTMDAYWEQYIADNFFTTNPLITRIWQLDGGSERLVKIRDAGQRIRETILYNKLPAASYDGGSTFTTDETEILTQLEFDWKGVYAPINLDERKVAQNSGNSERQFFDLVETIAEAAMMTILDLMGFQLYGTAPNPSTGVVAANGAILATDFDGLYNALDTSGGTYGTYGGITRGTTFQTPGAAINANVIAAGGAPLSKSLLQTGYSQAVFNKSHPDIGICRRDLWNELWERTEAQDRNPPGPLRDVGFDTIRFNGAEVVADDHQLPGRFYWLTSDTFRLWLLDGRDMVRRGAMYGQKGGFGVYNQPKTVDQLILDGNLVCCSPRLNTVINNIG